MLAAFFAVWELENLAFIEHFAVDARCRNGGLGAGLLQELLQGLGVQTVLEVEPPDHEMAVRRIHFYERNGFVLNPYEDYVQPALSEEAKDLPLRIMTYPSGVCGRGTKRSGNSCTKRYTGSDAAYRSMVSSTGQWSEPNTSVWIFAPVSLSFREADVIK